VEAVAPVTGVKRKRVVEAEGSGGDASAAMAAVLEGQGDEAAGSGFVEAEGGGVEGATALVGGVEGAPALEDGVEGAPALDGSVEGAPALVGGFEGAPALVGGFEGAPALVGGFEGAPALVGDVAVEVDVAGGFVGTVEGTPVSTHPLGVCVSMSFQVHRVKTLGWCTHCMCKTMDNTPFKTEKA
jgi:hypothetical protein